MKAEEFDSERDLVLEREIDVPVGKVWAAWTEPKHLLKWFVPSPWSLADCEVDLRPGGIFRTVMRSPEGEEFPSNGCYLEVIPNQSLVFTDALEPGFRPGLEPFMTARLTLKATKNGTLYRAVAMHSGPENAKKHADMGFADGWGKALDQLIELMS
ncbi:MAG TPA: polyketide cyclase [Leptospiraceae bacterium]|nr:polyketide cyclase [Spirochaetaceae bacterium]HBS04659.1 polyketide cyclase [Leptospiraceae bacterium]|tara:strand:+ start:36981 stop:37448 length:468 start_codon:yes stop_codon:yes gene_type:complete